MAKRKYTQTLPRARPPRTAPAAAAPPPPAATAQAAPTPAPIGWIRQDTLIVAGLVFCALLFYCWRLDLPQGFVFDEIYHGFTAGELAAGNSDAYLWDKTPPPGVAYEWTHPAMSKLIIQVGIRIFGNNEVGWRSTEALFGAMGIGLIYAMGRIMFNRWVGGFAAALLALDGLWFVQSRIAMNDVFLTFFILCGYLAFFLYLREPRPRSHRYLWLTGVALGLALATKWSAVYSLGLLGVVAVLREVWLLYRGAGAQPEPALSWAPAAIIKRLLQQIRTTWREWLRSAGVIAGAFALVPGVVYLGSYSQFFLMGHSLDQWIELQQQMYWYHSGLEATHPWASRWWTWPLMLKPVWYYAGAEGDKVTSIYGMGNPLIWWAFLPAIGFAVLDWLDRRWRSLALAVVLLGFFGQWLPWALSPRISFMYHMTPCVPFGCLAIGYALSRLRAPRLAIAAYLVPVLVAFIYFFPFYSAWPTTREYSEQHYWIAGWKPR